MILLPDANHIVHFFLDLYRRQMGLPEPNPRLMSARSLTDPKRSREITYQLKVTHDGKNHARRMSICRLGDDVVSKSICYKVIYDDLLVLKIPPEPVTDFDQYLKNIQLERSIAHHLSPDIPCVSPSMTAILKKNPEFHIDGDLSSKACEEELIHQLKQSPSLQRHLKIQGTFVLFMGLSSHLFFDQIIDKMHQQEKLFRNAISAGLDTMGDILAFQSAFGVGKEELFFSFANLQENYSLAMDHLLQQHGKNSHDIPEFRKKQWMFDQLAGKDISDDPHQLPDAFILDRKRLGKQVLSGKKKDVIAFIQLIQSDTQKTSHHRNRNTISGIINNLVAMLFHLKEKNTAIRDLKPDNMFLVGDSDNPDQFLTSADQFKLGLIDLETSVDFEETESFKQPVLAGTPFFATPSHIFENTILKEVFQDASRTFYLQDWFAAVGTIYNVATGKNLFEKTGKLLSEVVRMRSKAITRGEPLEDVLKNASWVFWHTACAEFEERMALDGEVFKDIPLSFGEKEKNMLLEETLDCDRLLLDQIKGSILKQPFFKGKNTQKNLFTAGAKKIATLEKNWLSGTNVPKTPPEISAGIVGFLRCIGHLKGCRAALAQQRPIFQDKGSPMTARNLIVQLFRLVFFFMYRPEWTHRKHPESF